MTTQAEARNDTMGLISSVGTAQSVKVLYDDVLEDVPNGDTAWARAILRHTTGGQSSLMDNGGKHRYTRSGLLIVQIFTPMGDGLKKADTLSTAFRDAVEGVTTVNGVWFNNVRINEVGRDGEWYQTNVLADFRYDEVR